MVATIRSSLSIATMVTIDHAHDSESPLAWQVAGAHIAYSTAADGDLRDPRCRSVWLHERRITARCVVPRQVHGVLVVDAQASPADHEQADGLVSRDSRLALGAFGADCPAVCLISDDALGIAHCGWRGTAAGIVPRLAASFARCSRQPPSAWHAFIGPGIAGRRYEVDAPVLGARAWPVSSLRPTTNGRALLDLSTVIAADLRASGITTIIASGVCTSGDRRLWSYRRCGAGQVQVLAVWRPSA